MITIGCLASIVAACVEDVRMKLIFKQVCYWIASHVGLLLRHCRSSRLLCVSLVLQALYKQIKMISLPPSLQCFVVVAIKQPSSYFECSL